MSELGRVCVFCGSSPGRDDRYVAATERLATALVERGIELVYGGGHVGLMGAVADAVLARGGNVTGVIPVGLFSREVGHRGLTELLEVRSMHERKQVMYDLSDAFVALPGGFGTLEELAEVTTWAQLGLHAKPIALLDVDGFWDPLVELLDGMVREGFLKEETRALVQRHTDAGAVLDALAAFEPPSSEKAIGPDER